MSGPRALIDLGAVVDNWRMLAERASPAQAAAVVKADAYGLGATPVGRALASVGCTRFYVAWPQEGAELRKAVGAGPEIAVFNGPSPDTLSDFAPHGLEPVLNSLEQIELWANAGPASIHVDTGMNRLGLSKYDWKAAAQRFPKPTRLLSHIACDGDAAHARAQLEVFGRAAALWPGLPRSLAATGGVYLGGDFTMEEIRPGVGIYGGGPAPPSGPGPKPVVTLTAPVLQVRKATRGETVGYGATWTAQRDYTLATVGLGYADGFIRAASNRGKAFVAGQKRPIVGRVSMDLIVVDVTGLEVTPGDDIEFLGPNMPLSEVAGSMNSIDYEVLTRLGGRVERVWTGE
jgi:alanine racemase